jgi:2-hydroxy-6-oxonona-2,4-dienedioate hydrolase
MAPDEASAAQAGRPPAPPEILQYPVEVDGRLTRVLDAGDSDRVALFIHGAGARADRWRRNLGAVAEAGYRAIAIDLPGHGFAAKGNDFVYETPAFAAYVGHYLEQISFTDLTLVGTSVGGHIAATVALQQPGRVASLVLIGASGIIDNVNAVPRVKGRLGDATLEGIRRKLERVFYDSSRVTDWLVREEAQINGSPGARAALDKLEAYLASGIRRHLIEPDAKKLLDTEVMLVWGVHDKVVPLPIGDRIHSILPRAEFVVIQDAGHVPYLEQPELFNRALLGFLAT